MAPPRPLGAPIIFLDIDGVLNHDCTTERLNGFVGIDPENVLRLNALLDLVPDSEVVISSTWRVMHPMPELVKHLTDAGFAYPERVIGKTPSYVKRGGERGHEIQEWIDEQREAPRAIVILDDADDMAHLAPFLVRTNWDGGLKEEHVAAAATMLTSPPPEWVAR